MYYKIILLGEVRVGKTTLRRSYMGENLAHSYSKTIGVDFALKRTQEGGFQIWDLAGEASPNTIRSHLKKSSGIIFIFDVMEPTSLEKLPDWIEITTEVLGTDLIIALVANKIDLRSGDQGLQKVDASKVLQDLNEQITGEVKYFETSALTGNGVDEVFNWLLSSLTEGKKNE